jgi:hypothetical protein
MPSAVKNSIEATQADKNDRRALQVSSDGFLFFRYLQNERSDFRAVGSKWQIVRGWIQNRVKD